MCSVPIERPLTSGPPWTYLPPLPTHYGYSLPEFLARRNQFWFSNVRQCLIRPAWIDRSIDRCVQYCRGVCAVCRGVVVMGEGAVLRVPPVITGWPRNHGEERTDEIVDGPGDDDVIVHAHYTRYDDHPIADTWVHRNNTIILSHRIQCYQILHALVHIFTQIYWNP